MGEYGDLDLTWWREHVAYAVDQRRKMRCAYVAVMAMLLLGVALGTLLAAQVTDWILIPVAAFATAIFATETREWMKSETNYRRSLRIRRAGMAAAARNETNNSTRPPRNAVTVRTAGGSDERAP